MKPTLPDPTALLPLKPSVLLILLVLVDGESHGYGIKKAVERRSEGKVRLEPGTLYRLLGRLLEDAWIEESDRRPDPALDDERRRYYRLTRLGRRVVQAEAERLASLVDEARARKLIKGPELV